MLPYVLSLGNSFFFFFGPHSASCRILVPWPGIKPGSRQWKYNVLTLSVPITSSLVLLNTWIHTTFVACRIHFPDWGSNLGPLHWERGVLATGSPKMSPLCFVLLTIFFKKKKKAFVCYLFLLPYSLLLLSFFFDHTTWHVGSPWPGIEPMTRTVEAWRLNHWNTREVPIFQLFYCYYSTEINICLERWLTSKLANSGKFSQSLSFSSSLNSWSLLFDALILIY